MNPVDYRIRSRKDELFGVITELLDSPQNSSTQAWVHVRLRDGRKFPFVWFKGTEEEPAEQGTKVRLSRHSGRWNATPA